MIEISNGNKNARRCGDYNGAKVSNKNTRMKVT
jgi:hypothetical protein